MQQFCIYGRESEAMRAPRPPTNRRAEAARSSVRVQLAHVQHPPEGDCDRRRDDGEQRAHLGRPLVGAVSGEGFASDEERDREAEPCDDRSHHNVPEAHTLGVLEPDGVGKSREARDADELAKDERREHDPGHTVEARESNSSVHEAEEEETEVYKQLQIMFEVVERTVVLS